MQRIDINVCLLYKYFSQCSHIYLLSLASLGVFQIREVSDTMCIIARIFHVCIMVQRAWMARLDRHSLKATLFLKVT